jgi:hypothetical protein
MSGLEGLSPSEFLSLTHTGDDFMLSLDIGALLSSPAISGLIGGAVASGMGSTEDITDEQLQQMSQMFAMMFAEATISFTETVADSVVSRAVLDINFPLDQIIGPGAGFALNLDLNLSGFNESVTLEVPEGAEPLES